MDTDCVPSDIVTGLLAHGEKQHAHNIISFYRLLSEGCFVGQDNRFVLIEYGKVAGIFETEAAADEFVSRDPQSTLHFVGELRIVKK